MKHNHKTKSVIVDGIEVEVDANIIPIVNWLNSFDGIKTIFSCEGFDDDEEFKQDRRNGIFGYPYVIFGFTTDKQKEAQELIYLYILNYASTLDIYSKPPWVRETYMGDPEVNDPWGHALVLEFEDKYDMFTFIEYIEKQKLPQDGTALQPASKQQGE